MLFSGNRKIGNGGLISLSSLNGNNGFKLNGEVPNIVPDMGLVNRMTLMGMAILISHRWQ